MTRRWLWAVLILATRMSAQPASVWKLLWTDEFTGAAGMPPDDTKWTLEHGGGGWGNHELQVYGAGPPNVTLDGLGHLAIRAISTPQGDYTSGRLKTEGKFEFQYGKVEARIRTPQGQGLWSALWMLGANRKSVGWPKCGEIDIFENIGRQPFTANGTIHGPGYSGGNGISTLATLPDGGPLADEFHRFAIEWAKDAVAFFLDGKEYARITPASLPRSADWVFNQPFYLILNLAVGGDWPGPPDETTKFPQEMLVDYVRVWQR